MKAEEIKQIQNETRIKQRGKLIYIHSLNPAISMVAISEDKFKPQNHPSYSPDLVHCKFIYIVSWRASIAEELNIEMKIMN